MAKKTKRTANLTEWEQEENWAVVRAACLAHANRDEWNDILAETAKRFGVPLREAKQRAYDEGWEFEWKAIRAREWLSTHGGGSDTEDEFTKRWLGSEYAHLVAAGPEGARLATAMGHELWTRQQACIARWEAFDELRAAREAYNAIEERKRGHNCADCPRARAA